MIFDLLQWFLYFRKSHGSAKIADRELTIKICFRLTRID